MRTHDGDGGRTADVSQGSGLRERPDAIDVLERAQAVVYGTQLELDAHHVDAVAEQLANGGFGRELADLVARVGSDDFTTGLAQVAIGSGVRPRDAFTFGRAPRFDSPFSPAGARPGGLVLDGVANMNRALGATDLPAPLISSDMWSGHLAGRVATVQRYVADSQQFDPKSEHVPPSRVPGRRGFVQRVGDLPLGVRVAGAAALTTLGALGVAHVRAFEPDAATMRDFTARDIAEQLRDDSLPPLDTALDQIREMQQGVRAASNTAELDVAYERVADAKAIATRVLRNDPELPDVLRRRAVDDNGTMTFDVDETALSGVVDLMAAAGIDDVNDALGTSADDFYGLAEANGFGDLAEQGLDALTDVAVDRGRWDNAFVFGAPAPIQNLVASPALDDHLLKLKALLLDPELDWNPDVAQSRDIVLREASAAFAFEASEESLQYLGSDGETLDVDQLTKVVELAALTDTTPERVINGPFDMTNLSEGRNTSGAPVPAIWPQTQLATYGLNAAAPDTKWSQVKGGLANATPDVSRSTPTTTIGR